MQNAWEPEPKPCEEVDRHINDYGWLRPDVTAPPRNDYSLELCSLLPKELPVTPACLGICMSFTLFLYLKGSLPVHGVYDGFDPCVGGIEH